MTSGSRAAGLRAARTRAALALAAALLCCWFAPLLAQQYPSRPVRIIVPFPAAGAVDALRLPEVQKRFLDQGLKPVGNSSAEMAAFVTGETARWQNVIRTANITLQ